MVVVAALGGGGGGWQGGGPRLGGEGEGAGKGGVGGVRVVQKRTFVLGKDCLC